MKKWTMRMAHLQIWIDSNIKTHNFISKYYWLHNYDIVKRIIPKAGEII